MGLLQPIRSPSTVSHLLARTYIQFRQTQTSPFTITTHVHATHSPHSRPQAPLLPTAHARRAPTTYPKLFTITSYSLHSTYTDPLQRLPQPLARPHISHSSLHNPNQATQRIHRFLQASVLPSAYLFVNSIQVNASKSSPRQATTLLVAVRLSW